MGENTLSTYEYICVIIRSWLQQLQLLPFYSSCNHQCVQVYTWMNIENDVYVYLNRASA